MDPLRHYHRKSYNIVNEGCAVCFVLRLPFRPFRLLFRLRFRLPPLLPLSFRSALLRLLPALLAPSKLHMTSTRHFFVPWSRLKAGQPGFLFRVSPFAFASGFASPSTVSCFRFFRFLPSRSHAFDQAFDLLVPASFDIAALTPPAYLPCSLQGVSMDSYSRGGLHA